MGFTNVIVDSHGNLYGVTSHGGHNPRDYPTNDWRRCAPYCDEHVGHQSAMFEITPLAVTRLTGRIAGPSPNQPGRYKVVGEIDSKLSETGAKSDVVIATLQ